MITIPEILERANGHISGSLSINDQIEQVVTDWREVQPGDLFVAIKDERQDGYRFVPDAYENGAAAVMVDEAWYRRYDLHDLPVIVVPDTRRAMEALAVATRPSNEATTQDVVNPHREGASSPPTVSEYPELDFDVELVGEMQDSAFNERQWLVQRDGRFVQVSELLYRVAEQVNGERSLAEIAERVTDSTEWLVTEENVRQIIQSKLIPLGIIAPEDDADVPEREYATASPLALNMRTRVIDPRVIEPVAGVLQYLFAPIVLVAVLVAIAVAHWWLYFRHGLMDGLVQLFLSPGLMLVLIPIVLLSSVFHEFGHASGLRYGGGRARGMGFGFYLIYPAFYTDTTDGYRLGRWAKVRTDLGGIYFHLIFAFGMVGLYFLTGQEFLLLTVFVINFEAVRQLIPFVRLDGYWLLADLTGIPDPFTQMKQVLQDAAARRRGVRHVAALKPWVKKVFVSYVLVTVPLLAAMMFFFIKRVPLMLDLIWSSTQLHAQEFAQARNDGDLTGMALMATSQLILLLQLLGITYMLFILGRGLVRMIWSGWNHPAPALRMGSAVGTIAVLLLLAYIWMP